MRDAELTAMIRHFEGARCQCEYQGKAKFRPSGVAAALRQLQHYRRAKHAKAKGRAQPDKVAKVTA